MNFKCSGCYEVVEVRPGGWAFLYSQILLHLSANCGRFEADAAETAELAHAATAKLMNQIGEI